MADAISHFNKMKVMYHNLIMQLEGDVLHQILNDGIKSGELKPLQKNEKDTAVFVLLCSLHGLQREMVMENNFELISPAVNTLSHMVMHGLKS